MMVCDNSKVGQPSKEEFAFDNGPRHNQEFQFYDVIMFRDGGDSIRGSQKLESPK